MKEINFVFGSRRIYYILFSQILNYIIRSEFKEPIMYFRSLFFYYNLLEFYCYKMAETVQTFDSAFRPSDEGKSPSHF